MKQSQHIESVTGIPKERLRPDVFQKSTDSAA
ncbi:hypothetical protein NL438_26410 [Klebsiella pneumoniae]|nr:hypothetical protein [Klebsiella pneumoniae]